jgi:lambda family phage tail tape measure protein
MANMGNMLNVLVGIEGGNVVISTLEQISNTMVDTAIKADRMNAMMLAASGNIENVSNKNLQFIKNIANELGLEILSSSAAFAKLTAATRETNLAGAETQKIFKAVSEANASVGGSAADLTGMLNALTQMISKGTVSMEELRGQLGERLPGTMQIAANAMGMTTAELTKMINEGRLATEEFIPQFVNALDSQFNPSLDTAQQNINRLSNAWTKFKQNIVNSDWVNAVVTNFASALSGANEYINGTYAEQKIILEQQKKFWNESDAFTRTILTSTGRGVDTKEIDKKIEYLTKMQASLDKQNAETTPTPIQTSSYVEQTAEFVQKHETDKLKIIENARQKELNLNETAWRTAILGSKDNAEMQLQITESFRKREEAINKQYDDKKIERSQKLAAPGVRAENRGEREYQSMVERSRDLIAGYENDIITIRGRTLTDGIAKIDALAQAQKQAEEEKLRNARLTADELTKAQSKLAEVNLAIDKKAAADKEELTRKTNETLLGYENDLRLAIAKGNRDLLAQSKLSQAAELKDLEDNYNQKIELARRSQQETSQITEVYNQRVNQLNQRYTDDRTRIDGTYWEKLTLRVRESTSDQISFQNQFTSNMVDQTMLATDTIANGFAEMVVSGKASWADLALSVIKSIEVMIIKMLALYAVQQLVGMFSAGAGGAMSSTAAQNAATITPSFQSGTYANGGAFMNGVEFFADGGLVNSPTMFNTARGLGVMGEAGPEAIMPLARGSDGKLGVRSNGSQSSSINIGAMHIQVQSKDNETSEETGNKIGNAIRIQLETLIDKQITNSIRTGNTLNPTQIATAF